MRLIKKIGSIYFAVTLCALLVILLIVSTSMESLWGTSFAQKTFYQTQWFDFLLSLLWINIFCSTILRFPFKKQHIGFLVTHIGILGLLGGSLLTRIWGIEGQILLYEGDRVNAIEVGGRQWMVTSSGQPQFAEVQLGKVSIPVEYRASAEQTPFCPMAGNDSQPMAYAATPASQSMLSFSVLQILENAERKEVVTQGAKESPRNYAISVHLKSQEKNFDETLWLMEYDSQKPHAYEEFLGPLRLALKVKQEETTPVTSPRLRLLNFQGEELASIDLPQSLTEEIVIGKGSYRLKNLQFFSHARVSDNILVNDPNFSFNPAVEFDLMDSKGHQKHFVYFAFFPEFESLHGKTSQDVFDVVVKLDVPEGKEASSSEEPSLVFTVASDGQISCRQKTKNDFIAKEQAVELGKSYPTGWMDIECRIESLLTHAQKIYSMVELKDKKEDKGRAAVEISVSQKDQTYSQWVMQGEEIQLFLPAGDVRLALVEKRRPLPFLLALKDFRKIDYPGTNNPASYESDVLLEDQKEGVKIEKTISMNKPLDYKGYRIFQSSYVQDPNGAEASIFTVAKNPGIPFIYWSSCIIFFGAFLQFFLKKDEEGKKRGKSA